MKLSAIRQAEAATTAFPPPRPAHPTHCAPAATHTTTTAAQAEKAKAADKAAKGKGASLNMGGKGKSGGLDEYIYDDSALPDGEDDFM